MADIVIRGVDIPKPNEGAYLMQVFNDGRTIVYHYAVNGNGFGTDPQKVIETKAVPLPKGYGRLIDADKLTPDMGNYITGGSGIIGSMCTMRGYSQRKN